MVDMHRPAVEDGVSVNFTWNQVESKSDYIISVCASYHLLCNRL